MDIQSLAGFVIAVIVVAVALFLTGSVVEALHRRGETPGDYPHENVERDE